MIEEAVVLQFLRPQAGVAQTSRSSAAGYTPQRLSDVPKGSKISASTRRVQSRAAQFETDARSSSALGVLETPRDCGVPRYKTSTTHLRPGAAASLVSVVSNDVADSISVRATYVAP